MRAARPQFSGSITLSLVGAAIAVGACASDEGNPLAELDAGGPRAEDAAAVSDAEAGPCTDDCEYFPPTCTPDALCPSGLFDPTDPGAGLNWRTRINAILGRSANDVWLAGSVGTVAHFDGTSWHMSDLGTRESQYALWLFDSGEASFGLVEKIYTHGLEFDVDDDGGAPSADGWSLRPPPSLPPGPWGYHRFASAAWAWPGGESLWWSTWDTLYRLRRTSTSDFEILPGAPPNACLATPCRRVRSIHGASAETLWAVGDMGLAVRITAANSDAPTATQLNARTWTGLAGVWAASDTDVWAVGGTGTICHYTGDPLLWDVISDVPTNEHLNAVWGTSPSDIWAVGNAGVALHYDGTRWSRVNVAGLGARRPDLTAVWSAGPGHVWIGGVGVLLALGGKP